MAGPTGTDSALRFLRDLIQGDVGACREGQEKLPASDFWHSGAGSRGNQCVPCLGGPNADARGLPIAVGALLGGAYVRAAAAFRD